MFPRLTEANCKPNHRGVMVRGQRTRTISHLVNAAGLNSYRLFLGLAFICSGAPLYSGVSNR